VLETRIGHKLSLFTQALYNAYNQHRAVPGTPLNSGERTVSEYCYVIINNAGHSWSVLGPDNLEAPRDPVAAALPQLLQDGWVPIRETPMGGGTSPLAHSLVLLEKNSKPAKPPRAARPPK
jgi:hypothetical protein